MGSAAGWPTFRHVRVGGDTTLDRRFNARLNHLTAIRLGLATTVALTHALQLGFGYQPHLGSTRVGDLAVDAFFVLSGFLLARSYRRLGSARRYGWHRFLRIMPGFWVCLLVTALVAAPLIARLQGRPALSVLHGSESAVHFLLANGLLLIRQFGISGLPQGVPTPGVMNGSLWTLFYEAACYAAVVLLGVAGGLRRRPGAILAVVAVLWLATGLHSAGWHLVPQERMLRFALLFLLGSALFVHGRRIPVHGGLAAAALAVLLGGLLGFEDYRVIGAPALAYLCLWAVVTRPPAVPPARPDVSYGLYVYHWPILQILTVAGFTDLGEVLFVVTGLTAALAAALVSWVVVERPALALKDAAWVTADERGLVRHSR